MLFACTDAENGCSPFSERTAALLRGFTTLAGIILAATFHNRASRLQRERLDKDIELVRAHTQREMDRVHRK
jgi:hypothetical protein